MIKLRCSQCNKPINRSRANTSGKHYCSRKCLFDSERLILTCPQCKKSFTRRKFYVNASKINYCSQKCYAKVRMPPFRSSKAANVKPTNKQIEFIVGTILGDGFLTITKNGKNAHMKLKQSIKSYVIWKKKILGKLAPAKITTYKSWLTYKGKTKYYTCYRLHSATHPIFTKFLNIFYPNNKENVSGNKILSPKILKHLTPFAIAVWFMDDGIRTNFHGSTTDFKMLIATDNFTFEENETLQQFFKSKYNINPKIILHSSGHPRLFFPPLEAEKLRELIKPYIIPCMKYKIRTS